MKEIFAKNKIEYDPREDPPVFSFGICDNETRIGFFLMNYFSVRGSISQDDFKSAEALSTMPLKHKVWNSNFISDISSFIKASHAECHNTVFEDLLYMQSQCSDTLKTMIINASKYIMNEVIDYLSPINILMYSRNCKNGKKFLPSDVSLNIISFLPKQDEQFFYFQCKVEQIIKTKQQILINDIAYLTFKDLILTDLMDRHCGELGLPLQVDSMHGEKLTTNVMQARKNLNMEINKLCNASSCTLISENHYKFHTLPIDLVTKYITSLDDALTTFLDFIASYMEYEHVDKKAMEMTKSIIVNLKNSCEPLLNKLKKPDWHIPIFRYPNDVELIKPSVQEMSDLANLYKSYRPSEQTELIAKKIYDLCGEFTGHTFNEMYKIAVKLQGANLKIAADRNNANLLKPVQGQLSIHKIDEEDGNEDTMREECNIPDILPTATEDLIGIITDEND
jgi:hypothetical protein